MNQPPTDPAPRDVEQVVEVLLHLPQVNLGPIVQAMYPSLPPKTAQAKFHNKRLKRGYHKFSRQEVLLLQQIFSEHLRPILDAYNQLLSFPADAES